MITEYNETNLHLWLTYFVNHTKLPMDNYGTVDNPARISTVLRALMLVTQSRHQESSGQVVARSLLRMIDPMSVPVSFIIWTYVQMCAELQCSVHMRGATHDIFKWWIMEALEFTPRYDVAVQAYYRMLISSDMVQTNNRRYQVRDVIHVRDLLLYTAHMYSFDLIEDDYMWSMNWSSVPKSILQDYGSKECSGRLCNAL